MSTDKQKKRSPALRCARLVGLRVRVVGWFIGGKQRFDAEWHAGGKLHRTANDYPTRREARAAGILEAAAQSNSRDERRA